MACGSSSHSHPVNRNGPGSAASSTFEKIVQPGGGKSKCIDCGEFECCCIPCTRS
ncbi:hypothetical protein F4775DRAFT_596018 [Biscogniauxia sp. FL1348]|nr:hypothetical protein F4775DRAFT_596018 [Biscogniauxia sp. FL1348]